MAIVEPMLKFIQIGVQMLHADFVVSANDRPLKKTPNAFHSVRMNIAMYPFLRTVIDSLMLRVGIGNAFIRGKLISVDGVCIRCRVLVNESVQCFPVNIPHNFESDFPLTLNS